MCVAIYWHVWQGSSGSQVFRRSIQGMLEELEYNLWEAILVRLVDYGHTFSPGLEMSALRSVAVGYGKDVYRVACEHTPTT